MFEAISINHGWSTALIGITTVFIALIVVSSAVALYSSFFRRLDARSAGEPAEPSRPRPAPGAVSAKPVAAVELLAASPAPAFYADEAAVAIIAVAIEAKRRRRGQRMAEAARNARASAAAWIHEGRARALSNRPR